MFCEKCKSMIFPKDGKYVCKKCGYEGEITRMKSNVKVNAPATNEIAVVSDDAVKLPKGRYYTADLIGMTVTDDDHGELGVVSDCFEGGSGHILEIKRQGKKNLLIPFVKEYCYEVSVESSSIRCKLPAGLYELYE